MDDRCLEEIERFFYRRTGITYYSKKRLFYIKITQCMERLGIYECERFLERLVREEELFLLLVEELTVSQSFFFREEAHFELLVEYMRGLYRPKILSAPCATGEEPYSIAIALLEGGIEDFAIEAVDLSRSAIAKGEEGRYRGRDLLNVPQNIIERYFEPVEDGYRIVSSVKERIEFRVANIFELRTSSMYDAIFCRNFFIYLDNHFKRKALDIFHQLLKPEGYLFVSFSDYLREHEGFDKITVENKEIYKKANL